ncbi:MAG: folylpolyglutamate synthase/dihydrofolate synthase family protein [Candidatus Nanohaloarchaea archaeon]
MGYREAVEELTSRGSDRKEPALENTKKALEELGRPDRETEIILVGGTNGKGSVSGMIYEMLRSQGNSAGLFRSPHLVDLRERVEKDGEMIGREEFMELYQRIGSLEPELSFFEFMTVLAYRFFRDTDYAVMEVGMGGRLDATNAAEPEIAVITNVELEHRKYLGRTREKIADEIAGITPEDGVLVTDVELENVIDEAERNGTAILRPEKSGTEGEDHIVGEERFDIPLRGSFQSANLADALKAVEALGERPDDVEGSLSGISCPGRMEVVDRDPLYIHDGAHNPHALREVISDYPEGFAAVFSALESKEVDRMVEVLEEKAEVLYLTESDVDWCMNPDEIQELCSVRSEVVRDPGEAVRTARDRGLPVVVTGSLYLVGAVRSRSMNDRN